MTDSAAPVWLLDVDGVINAFRAGWYTSPSIIQIYSPTDAYDYRIRFEPRLISAIRRLHGSGAVEVTWCTTWCSDAAALEEGLGLPRLPRAVSEPVTVEAACAVKWAAAQRVIASGRRLIWTDDVEVECHAGESAPWADRGRALLIGPHASRGLRPHHLRRIEEFLAR